MFYGFCISHPLNVRSKQIFGSPKSSKLSEGHDNFIEYGHNVVNLQNISHFLQDPDSKTNKLSQIKGNIQNDINVSTTVMVHVLITS